MGNDRRTARKAQGCNDLIQQRTDGNSRRICWRPDLLLPLGIFSCTAGSDLQATVYYFKYIHFGSKPVIKSQNGLFQLRASRRAQD